VWNKQNTANTLRDTRIANRWDDLKKSSLF
jgi:hypothetical protein